MEPIVDYLKRKLIEAGSTRWEAIAAACGIAKTLPRKIAYGDRENPGVQTVQPLLDFFQAVDRGERQFPPLVPAVEAPAAEPQPPTPDRRQPSDHPMQETYSGQDVAAQVPGEAVAPVARVA